MLLLSEPESGPGPEPGLGAPASWVDCAVSRVWVLHYMAAGNRQKLPQAKSVRAKLVRWAADQGLKSVRVAILARLDEAEIVRLLHAWDLRRGAVGSDAILAYPVSLPSGTMTETEGGAGSAVSLHDRLGWLFARVLPWADRRLAELHREEILEAAPDWDRPVWKHGALGPVPDWAPSRVGRCLLETVGRVLRSQAERRQAFVALRAVWDADVESDLAAGRCYPVVRRAVDACAGELPATGLVLGVAEQLAADHRRRVTPEPPERAAWRSFYGQPAAAPWAETYVELQPPPQLHRSFLTLAADDGGSAGQAVRYTLDPNGSALSVSLLLPADPDLAAWSWCSFRIELPERARAELSRGGRLRAPDLRRTRSGKWVLDVKVSVPPNGRHQGAAGRVLAFDWGLRKIISAVVMEAGQQLSRPFFLQVGGVYAKLKELRAHASLLRRKVDRLRNRRLFGQGLTEPERTALEEEGTQAQTELDSIWRRYAKLQDELAHLAANYLLRLAQDSGCRVIVGEWLGSLKSRDRSRDLNWRINSQIRAKILEKLRYKARRAGIAVRTVWPRGTSHRCPRCGADKQWIADLPPGSKRHPKPGHRPRSSSWFVCGSCGFNGDRDYVASLNISVEYFAEQATRRVAEGDRRLAGKRLSEAASDHRQVVSYRGTSAARPFPSQNERIPSAGRRRGYLHGWRNRQVRVRPLPGYIRMIA